MVKYYKQEKLYNPEKDKQPNIYIYGCGSIGSHVTIGLLKTGFNNITIYDYDRIEEENLPAQFYDQESIQTKRIGNKVAELIRIGYKFTGKSVQGRQIKIEETFEPNIEINSIHILAFDNIEARKIMKEKLAEYPLLMIDGRIGGWNNEVYCVQMNKEEEVKKYEETLNKNFSELQCGEKTLWANNSYIASKIIINVIKFCKEEELFFKEQTNIKGKTIIGEIK